MDKHIYLVMDADRDVLDVCDDQASAYEFAKAQNATVEVWPISSNPRAKAWARALDVAASLTGRDT
jgi:hypothetical protein